MRSPRWRILSIIAIVSTSSVVTGCGPSYSPAKIDANADLSLALDEAFRSGNPALVSDYTDFDWDTMTAFASYSNGAEVVATTGVVALAGYESNFESQGLLVFCSDGKFVAAQEVTTYWAGAMAFEGTFTSRVQATKFSVDTGGWVDPAGEGTEPACDSQG